MLHVTIHVLIDFMYFHITDLRKRLGKSKQLVNMNNGSAPFYGQGFLTLKNRKVKVFSKKNTG